MDSIARQPSAVCGLLPMRYFRECVDLGVVRMILESAKDVDTSGETYHSFPIILLKTCLFRGFGKSSYHTIPRTGQDHRIRWIPSISQYPRVALSPNGPNREFGAIPPNPWLHSGLEPDLQAIAYLARGGRPPRARYAIACRSGSSPECSQGFGGIAPNSLFGPFGLRATLGY